MKTPTGLFRVCVCVCVCVIMCRSVWLHCYAGNVAVVITSAVPQYFGLISCGIVGMVTNEDETQHWQYFYILCTERLQICVSAMFIVAFENHENMKSKGTKVPN